MTAVEERIDVEDAEDTRERVTVWDTGELLYVHPAASIFPMMSDDELDDLAEHIRRNGLIHPIVLDQHQQLLDGRNRLEACRRAQVAPDFTRAALDDPVAFIEGANVERRQLTKGQQAMARVMGRWVTQKMSPPTDPSVSPTAFLGVSLRALGDDQVSRERVRRAAVVLRSSVERAEAVLSGATLLDDAYTKVQDEKRLAESDDEKLARLKEQAPDLAYMVAEAHLTLAGALAELQERKRKEQERERKVQEYRALTTQQLDSALAFLDPRQIEAVLLGQQLAANVDPDALPHRLDMTPGRIRACAAVLEALAEALTKKEP